MLCLLVVILGRRKRTAKFELQGCRRSRSSHCQEPLAGASRVFPDITPFVSGGELKGVQSEFKGVQSELKGVQGERTEVKVRAKESDKNKARKGRRQKRRLKERFVRTVVGEVCLS